jgi:hypothetical protein
MAVAQAADDTETLLIDLGDRNAGPRRQPTDLDDATFVSRQSAISVI